MTLLNLQRSRWGAMAIVCGALLTLALWRVSDAAMLTHAHELDSADFIAYTVCHRLPTHSFTIAGRTMPLCARCSGIYLGIFLIFALVFLTGRLRHAAFPKRHHLITLAILFGAMAIDGINSLLHDIGVFELYEPNNVLRLITGMGAGLAMALVVLPAFAQTVWFRPQWEPLLQSHTEFATVLVTSAIIIALVLSNQPTLLFVLAIMSAVGVLSILTIIYTVLLLSLLRREGQIHSIYKLMLPLAGGLVFTLIQILLLANLRFYLTGTWAGF